MYIDDNISLSSSKNEKYFRKKCCREKQSTFMFNNPPTENRDVYEITWKNMVEPDRLQMTTDNGTCALNAG